MVLGRQLRQPSLHDLLVNLLLPVNGVLPRLLLLRPPRQFLCRQRQQLQVPLVPPVMLFVLQVMLVLLQALPLLALLRCQY